MNSDLVRVSVNIPKGIYDKLEEQKGQTVSSVIVESLKPWLKNRKPLPPEDKAVKKLISVPTHLYEQALEVGGGRRFSQIVIEAVDAYYLDEFKEVK